MTNSEFREWLKGFFELSEEGVTLSAQQVQVIVNHLNLAEAVSGQLDDANQLARADIQVFRSVAAPGPGDFSALTEALRDNVLGK